MTRGNGLILDLLWTLHAMDPAREELDSDGQWAGDFDPLADEAERRVLFAALDSFR